MSWLELHDHLHKKLLWRMSTFNNCVLNCALGQAYYEIKKLSLSGVHRSSYFKNFQKFSSSVSLLVKLQIPKMFYRATLSIKNISPWRIVEDVKTGPICRLFVATVPSIKMLTSKFFIFFKLINISKNSYFKIKMGS